MHYEKSLNISQDLNENWQELTGYYNGLQALITRLQTDDMILLTLNCTATEAPFSIMVQISLQNLQMAGTIRMNQISTGPSILVSDTTYNHFNGNLAMVFETFISALKYFNQRLQNPSSNPSSNPQNDTLNFIVLLFYLSEAARNEVTQKAVELATNPKAIAGDPRLSWNNHKPIMKNWSTVLTATGGSHFLTLAAMKDYSAPPAVGQPDRRNGTQMDIYAALHTMGYA